MFTGMWIRTGRLTPPAVRTDGTLDVGLADAQLLADPKLKSPIRARLERLATQNPPRPAARSKLGRRQVEPAPAPDMTLSHLNRAKMLSALVEAERARRRLEQERGRYLLKDDVIAVWSTGQTEIIRTIEYQISVLERELGGDLQTMQIIRNWWRETRTRIVKAVEATPGLEFRSDPNIAQESPA